MDPARVPAHRIEPLRRLADTLLAAQRIVLITHVNADGDGAGRQAAVAARLRALRKDVHITNPTVFPDNYRYLVDADVIVDHTDGQAARCIREADLVFVLDTGEPQK